MHGHALGQELGAARRHVLEIESHHVHAGGERSQSGLIVERGHLQRCHLNTTGIGGRIEQLKAQPHRRTGQDHHAGELTAAQNANGPDAH